MKQSQHIPAAIARGQKPRGHLWFKCLAMWALGFGHALPSMAQLEAEMECVQVNQAGNAIVTWSEAMDPADVFQQYVIHIFEPSSGIVLETVSIPNPTDPVNPSYVNTTYDANVTELCYFIVTEGPAGVFGPVSDTLCSIHLTAEASLTPGIVDLNFNSPWIGSNLPPAFETLSVESQDDDGSWQEIASILDNGGMMTAQYELEECTGDLLFRVKQYNDAGDCFQMSNSAGSSLADELDPDPPTITAVQVEYNLQEAMIQWQPSPADDLAGYIIYLCNGGFQMAIDTIYDPLATTYIDLNSNVQAYIESYNVAAFDSCFVNGEPDPGAASPYCATSLFLNATTAICSDVANLSWTGAFNLPSDPAHYEIWVNEESPSGSGNWSGLTLLETVDASMSSWQHTGASYGSTYRYHVVLQMNSGLEILSNARSLEFSYPGSPDFTSLRRASVNDSGAVSILVDLDPNNDEVHTYTLQRQVPGDATFFDLETQEGIGGMVLQFTDYSADTKSQSYTYRIEVHNFCGDSVGASNAAQTVWLRGLTDFQLLRNTLHWTPYADFPGATAGYRVYRKYNLGGATELIATLPHSVFTWEDDVSNLLESPGDFCYIVEAMDALPGPSGGINYAFSNEMCLTQEPVVWVPNAILIGGENNIFKPVISFADFTNYRMEILSRWGDVLFSTEDAEEGWDGTYQGTYAPEGSFGYFITLQDGSGKIFQHQGMMHLLIGDLD